MKDADLAIGLQYKPHFPAPMILFKAKGKQVESVLLLAQKFQIPLRKEKDFTNICYILPEGAWIPENQFHLVAQILSQVYSLKDQSNESIGK